MSPRRPIPVALVLAAALGFAPACADDPAAPPANSAPVADAGPDQAVSTGVTVTLDATGSSDPDDDSLAYAWQQVAGPTVTLSDPTAVHPTFTAPRYLTAFRFSLVLSDGDTTSTPDTVTVVVDRFTQFTIAGELATANSDTETPGRFAVATDGSRTLVVTCRTGSGLIGVVVGPEGAVLHTAPIVGHDCAFPRPALAFDGAGFLLAFQRGGEIVATRLTVSAAAIGVGSEAVLSSGTSNWSPAVAFDGVNHLVAWNKFIDYPDGHDIYGARVTAGGQSLGEFPIFVRTGEQGFASVAFDGTNYLVVWQDTRTGSGPSPDTDLYGTRVSPAGTVLDSVGLAIATAPNFQGEPQLIFGGADYFAVWVDARNHPLISQPPLDLFGTRISPAGTLLDGPAASGGIAIRTADVAPGTLFYPSAIFDGTNYLVAFAVTDFFPPAGVYLARVSAGGALLDGPPDQLGPSISGPPASASRFVYPAIALDAETVLVAWVDNIELSGSVKSIVGTIVASQPVPGR